MLNLQEGTDRNKRLLPRPDRGFKEELDKESKNEQRHEEEKTQESFDESVEDVVYPIKKMWEDIAESPTCQEP